MDGAIADGEGEAYPLIATTERDLLRNLRKNLTSHLKKRFPRKKAVFVTSRPVTPQQRFKLEEAARERGFVLVQVIDQVGIADRLYRNSRRCRSLLGLSGEPSALSVVPVSRRPLLDLEPVGRSGDLEWLRSTGGDRVLAGEPGSGKTFLLSHLARHGWGLFLTSEDPAAIANAIREQSPDVVIVDDAHADPERLTRLRQLRREVGAELSIVAVTWRGSLDVVREALGEIGDSQVRQLELLTRNELVEVVKQVGIHGPGDLIRELVNQSANKPGLAVTLALAALRGELESILDGTVVRRSLVTAFRGLTGTDRTLTLASFSLGGNAGMTIEAVADFLRFSRPEIVRQVTELAAGGILSERGDQTLAVYPRILRWNLLRLAFFAGAPTDQPYEELLDSVPSSGEATETLLAAVARARAVIPDEKLRRLLQRAGTCGAWEKYVSLGEEQARWALDNYPGNVVDLAREALRVSPEATLPRLLERAVGDEGPLRSRPSHPLRIVQSWIREARVPAGEPLSRRRQLAGAASRFLEEGGDRDVGVHALCIALSPALEETSVDPGLGDTVSFSFGVLPEPDRVAMHELWAQARGALAERDSELWQPFAAALGEWTDPISVIKTSTVAPEIEAAMHGFAHQVLADLAQLFRGSPGALSQMHRLARRMERPLDLDLDPAFERLFPDRWKGGEEYPQWESARQEGARAVADEWCGDPPARVAERLAFLEREAEKVGHSYPRLTPELARGLAEMVAEPERWVEAFVQRELPGDLVEPFLAQVVRRRTGGWEERLAACLEDDRYAGYAMGLVLTMEDASADLLAVAVEDAPRHLESVVTLCLRKEVPLAALSALLRHSDWQVALAVAMGEWAGESQGEVRPALVDDWRRAVLRAKADPSTVGAQYWLGEILASQPALAYRWLLNRLGDGDLPTAVLPHEPEIPLKALEALDPEQKASLLGQLQPDPALEWLLPALVGDDGGLYRRLLELPALEQYHLRPLYGLPDAAWADKARAALDSGYGAEAVARASILGGTHMSWGSGVEYWQKWAHAFAGHERHGDERLREVARHGREIAERLRNEEKVRKRKEELKGV